MSINPNPNEIKFSWSNYFKPTPQNLQYFATVIRGLFALVTGTSIVMNASELVSLGFLISGYLLDEFIKFLGRAAQDYEQDITIKETTLIQKETTITGIPSTPPGDDSQEEDSTENISPSE